MTRLAASGLTVRRGGRAILADVSLEIEGGAFVAVLGPNGAGKSTLLVCLAGLLTPDAGHVTLDGRPLGALRPRELARTRAFLPQSPRAEWPISVERLVALGLTPHLPAFGPLAPAHRARVAEVLEEVDLLDRRDQAATTLSGGELGRAMLARALVGRPTLLIADEPLAGLDPRHALEGAARLRALAEGGTLVIASLHDLTLAARFADQAILLKQGRLEAHGPVATTLAEAAVAQLFDVAVEVRDAGTPGATVDLRLPRDRLDR